VNRSGSESHRRNVTGVHLNDQVAAEARHVDEILARDCAKLNPPALHQPSRLLPQRCRQRQAGGAPLPSGIVDGGNHALEAQSDQVTGTADVVFHGQTRPSGITVNDRPYDGVMLKVAVGVSFVAGEILMPNPVRQRQELIGS
jgi:hypothetical protein